MKINIKLLMIGTFFSIILLIITIFLNFNKFESMTMMMLYLILYNQILSILNIWESKNKRG